MGVPRLSAYLYGHAHETRLPTGDAGSARQMQFALKLLF
jgi:hypothetical protein